MDKKSIENELAVAYEKLERAEKEAAHLRRDIKESDKIIRVLTAAGFLTEEKLEQAREIITGLDI